MDCEADGWVSLAANGRCRQHQSHCLVPEISWMEHYEQACEMVAESLQSKRTYGGMSAQDAAAERDCRRSARKCACHEKRIGLPALSL